MNRKAYRRGIALVWTVVVLLGMILMVGLSLDAAITALAAHQLHNAADAAALAGAQWVKFDQDEAVTRAFNTAKANYAMQNDVDLAYAYSGGVFTNDMDIILGQFFPHRRLNNDPPWFVPTIKNPNAVKAVARRTTTAPDGPVDLVFGRIISIDTIDVSRYAIALSNDTSGAGIIALAPTGTGLLMNGNLVVDCNGGEIQVNSTSTDAVKFNGNPEPNDIIARQLNVCGEVWGKLQDQCPIPYLEGVDAIPDPLASEPRPAPPFPTPAFPTTVTQSTHPGGVLQPGYYPGGLFLSGGTWTLEPGVYLLGGATWDASGNQIVGKTGLVITGNTVFNAEYCQFFITKSLPNPVTGEVAWGKVEITGTGTITISPPGDNPANYVGGKPVVDGAMGVSIWQDDLNTEQVAKIVGDGDNGSSFTGTLYFPHNTIDIAGNNLALGNQLIANRIEPGGTGHVCINYDGRNRGQADSGSCIVE
jgi:hypothetical protein